MHRSELVDGGEDGIRAVLVDEVDERLQVTSGGVVFGVVLQFAPGREEKEFGVPGAAAFLEVAGGGCQALGESDCLVEGVPSVGHGPRMLQVPGNRADGVIEPTYDLGPGACLADEAGHPVELFSNRV